MFAIPYTGRTKATIESAKIAKESGATVIGLTKEGSPLSEYCSIVLGAETIEDTEVYTPTVSRLVPCNRRHLSYRCNFKTWT